MRRVFIFPDENGRLNQEVFRKDGARPALKSAAQLRSLTVCSCGYKKATHPAYPAVAARYALLSDWGTVTLRVADLFNTLRYNSTAYGADFSSRTRFKWESRIAYLGFAYRFGQHQVSRAKSKSESDDAGGSGFD